MRIDVYSWVRTLIVEKKIPTQKKTIENSLFHLKYYICDNCGKSFTISSLGQNYGRLQSHLG